MAIILKYSIPDTACEFDLEIPLDSEIIHVDTQYGHPKIWVKSKSATSNRKWKFSLIETGKSFDDTNLQYIATIYLYAGTQVFHLFEVTN